jgi:hypothetical protein
MEDEQFLYGVIVGLALSAPVRFAVAWAVWDLT